MSAQTTMSGKGQVVIPKDVRDALGISAGQRFEVVTVGGDVVLRPRKASPGRSTADVLESIRAIAGKYQGSPVTIEEMNETIARGWATGFRDRG